MNRSFVLLVSLVMCTATGAWAIKEQKVLDQSVFPAPGARPPLWPFRPLSSANVTVLQLPSTGWRVTVKHRDIKGVNSKMMKWLFTNLATGSSIHPYDKKTYPNFLMMHPRDHILHTAAPSPLRARSVTNWVEFPLTHCSQDGGAKSFSCPAAPDSNPGFTTGTPAADWTTIDQVNGTSTVLSFGGAWVEFGSRGCNDAGACAFVVRTRQSWLWVKKTNSIKLTTTLRVGIGLSEYDPKIVTNWANGFDPETKCYRSAQHFVEEYGALENWLPQSYNRSMGLPVNE